jgi:hypothetical protein
MFILVALKYLKGDILLPEDLGKCKPSEAGTDDDDVHFVDMESIWLYFGQAAATRSLEGVPILRRTKQMEGYMITCSCGLLLRPDNCSRSLASGLSLLIDY